MKREYIFISIFFAVVAVTTYLFYRIIAPFLISLSWAAIFAIIFYPLYTKLGKHVKSANLRALIVTTLIVLLIIGPAAYLGVALVKEAISMFDHIKEWVDSGGLDKVETFLRSTKIYGVIQKSLSPKDLFPPDSSFTADTLAQGGQAVRDSVRSVDLSRFDLDAMVTNSFKSLSKFALVQATNALTNAGMLVFHFSLMIFFMFFFFRDGEALYNQVKTAMPMSRERSQVTFIHLRRVIEGTMYGGIVVSLLQGIIGGLLFVIMGLPSPVFWGAFMAFLAFIPIVGPSLVYIPAGIILILSGAYIKGIIIIVVGTLVVSQIDNFLRPVLVSGKTQMHTMLLFISIMGGVAVFGLLGLVMGPLIAALFVTLFDVFRMKMMEGEEGEVLASDDLPPGLSEAKSEAEAEEREIEEKSGGEDEAAGD